MSYQIIAKMSYNAETRQIETWQHSNNVWPRTNDYYALDATDDNLFDIIKLIADRVWQARKWCVVFEILFAEFPELIAWREICDTPGSYDDQRYNIQLANFEAWRNKPEIVARFKQLAKIH